MNEQKIMRVLFLVVPVLLLLSIFWHLFAPFLSLALLYLMLLVIRSGFVQTLLGRCRDPPVVYYSHRNGRGRLKNALMVSD